MKSMKTHFAIAGVSLLTLIDARADDAYKGTNEDAIKAIREELLPGIDARSHEWAMTEVKHSVREIETLRALGSKEAQEKAQKIIWDIQKRGNAMIQPMLRLYFEDYATTLEKSDGLIRPEKLPLTQKQMLLIEIMRPYLFKVDVLLKRHRAHLRSSDIAIL